MSVRFIIGRAGSGKTYRCIQAVRKRLSHDAIDGPRLILLVPEQAALQMERAAIMPGPPFPLEPIPFGRKDVSALRVGHATQSCGDTLWETEAPEGSFTAAHRLEVLSFRRLAFRVVAAAGGPPKDALSEPARTMVLRLLLRRHRGRLRYYRSFERGGLGDKLGESVAELIEEMIAPDALAPSAVTDQRLAADPAQSAKIHDLHLLYAAYLEYLGQNRLDPSQQLQLTRRHLSQCSWLHGAELWVDGFASHSAEEQQTLVALAGLCSNVEITVLLDPSMAETPPESQEYGLGQSLFRRVHQTYQQLHHALADAGLPVDEPIRLDGRTPRRFIECRQLALLEARLFQTHGTGTTVNAAVNAAANSVEIVSLPSRRLEVEYAVARVCQWVQSAGHGYRYREMAIIVRDMEPYRDLLTEALRARNVPFFIDQRRRVAHHPLVELLRAALAVVAEDFSLDSVRLLLKTGLLPMAADETDELENYLLATGVQGLNRWRDSEWKAAEPFRFAEKDAERRKAGLFDLERINESRRTLMSALNNWLTFAAGVERREGAQWADALNGLLADVGVPSALHQWSQEAEERGDLDLAEEHRQVWREVASLLDDVGYAFGGHPITVEELADALDAALSGLTLGLAPPMIDQLLVGSIERSRHPEIKAAVILGFNDGVFPRRSEEDAILNDDDRRRLNDAGIRVRPSTRERILDERLLVYIAITRPSRNLLITFAGADEQGRALRPSPYLESLKHACPGLNTVAMGDPVPSRSTWSILTVRDLARLWVMEVRSRPPLDKDDPLTRAKWNELFERSRVRYGGDWNFRAALVALDDPPPVTVSRESVELLYGGRMQTSASQLETYAACPFQFFARYVLALEPRREAGLAAVDVGRLHHAVLEDFGARVASLPEGFRSLGEQELLNELQRSHDRVIQRLGTWNVESPARERYVLRRSAELLGRVIRAQRRVAHQGRAVPVGTEIPFGIDPPGRGLPALSLLTPSGRTVTVRGFIDRVDLAELGDEMLGIVIDYKKSREKQLNMAAVYHGLSLQLLAYLLVIGESGRTLAGRPIRPGGALYVNLVPRYERVLHPDRQGPRSQDVAPAYRPRGLISSVALGALDQDESPGWSRAYSVFRKADGTVGNLDHSDAADDTDLTRLLSHTKSKLAGLADGILDGQFSVRPFRLGDLNPCSWCPVKAVCRFEMGLCEVRFLERLPRSEVFRRLASDD